MSPKLLLRVASVLIFIHAALHTIGFSGWKEDPDPAKQQVIRQMTGQKFPFMGVPRNMGEYYDGFGYGISVTLFLIAVLLWIVSGELSPKSTLVKKIIITISFGLLLWGIDELVYFFPFAASLALLACICCFWSLAGLAKQGHLKQL